MKRILLVVISLIWTIGCTAQTETDMPQSHSHLVLTSLAPLYQLTTELTSGTSIAVQNIPERARSMSSQPTYFQRQSDRLTGHFQQAEAVVGISRVWSQDPLYLFAREANIRIVNVDAALPWSHERSGVALTRSTDNGDVSPYFWTGPSNVIRMAEIVAFDLKALFPDEESIIDANLQAIKAGLLTIKASTESRLLEINDPFVYALTDELTTLTNELGIFVDDYFIKQDIDWTSEDLEQLSTHLQEASIPVVIHKWEPTEEIQSAITAGGAKLVVLDNMELTDQPLVVSIRNNVENLLDGFSK